MVTVQGHTGISPSKSETVTSYPVSAAAADLSHDKREKNEIMKITVTKSKVNKHLAYIVKSSQVYCFNTSMKLLNLFRSMSSMSL